MAKLRVDKIASVGVSTETTGSVYFDGSSDYLTVESSTDFAFGTGDFTIELWAYFDNTDNNMSLYDSRPLTTNGLYPAIQFESTNNTIRFYVDGSQVIGENNSITAQTWHHIAVARSGSSTKMFVDGRQIGSTYSDTNDYLNGSPNRPIVGVLGYNLSVYNFNGYISNLRVCKGHAVYKSNFAVPTRELDVHPGPEHDRTVLLACYDGVNIFADKTGRHIISAYGDRTSSPTPTATDSPIGITTFQPGLDRDVDNTFGPTFQGGAGYASQNWLTLPKGTTTDRNRTGGRGVFGSEESNSNAIDYISISSMGNSQDFGDLIEGRSRPTTVSSYTRGIFGAGYKAPGGTNTMEFITISTTGNAQTFGELLGSWADSGAGMSNNTRGVYSIDTTDYNTIEYVTIASLGDSQSFGDLSVKKRRTYGCSSSVRGLIAGGYEEPATSESNIIHYITLSSTGDSIDFGDLTVSRFHGAGCSSSTRGVFGSGVINPAPSTTNVIDYVTIASTGNAQDFGDAIGASRIYGSTSNSTRGIFGGGLKSPVSNNSIEYITISSTGNGQDFGDLTGANGYGQGALSDSHGGIS